MFPERSILLAPEASPAGGGGGVVQSAPLTPPPGAEAAASPAQRAPAAIQPAAQAGGTPVVPKITEETKFVFQGPDGKDVEATVADLIAAHGRVSAMKPEDVRRFELYSKAVGGNDFEAARQLMDTYAPAKAEPVATRPDDRIAALENSVKALMSFMEGSAPAIGQFQGNILLGRGEAAMKGKEKECPFVTKHPQGAKFVIQQFRQLAEAAAERGMKNFSMETQNTMMDMAVKLADESLRSLLSPIIAGMTKAAPGDGGGNNKFNFVTGETPVMEDEIIPARFRMVPGLGYVTQEYAALHGAANAGNPSVIPNTPLTGNPPGVTGASPGAPGTLRTMGDLRSAIRAALNRQGE